MLSGNVSPFFRQKGSGATGGRPKRNLERRAARRHVLPGYPVDSHPMSAAEVAAYFSGDRIVCLLCGKGYRRLATHIENIHAKTEDDYRSMYGIPWRRGLTSADCHDAYGRAMKRKLEDDRVRAMLIEGLERGREMLPPAHLHRKRQPCSMEMYTQRMVLLAAQQRARGQKRPQPVKKERFSDRDAEEFLRRIATGRTPASVANDSDMPSYGWIRKYKQERQEFCRRYWEVIDLLPFHVQAEMESLGPRFERELRGLFDVGLSDHAAAAQLGVTAMACNKRTKGWRAAAGRKVTK